MKILYDNQIFETQKIGGISRYFVELMREFKKDDKVRFSFPIKETENIYLKTLPFLSNIKSPKVSFNNFIWGIRFPGRGRLYRSLYRHKDKKKIIHELKKGNFDLFHPTYYDPYFLKYIGKKPFILTVYDMTHEMYPNEFLKFDFSAKNKNKLVQKATKIITISEKTKEDLIDFCGIPEEKIEVVYFGNSFKAVKEKPQNAPKLPSKYVLFVGGRMTYKNFQPLVKSIVPLLKKDKKLHIVCAGPEFSEEEKNMFEELGIKGQIESHFADSDVLSYMYQNALCFVFPSLYEGFGLPTLEAFSCGCPTIISNTSCMPEVGGDAALYINPKDSNDMLNKVKNVIEDKKLRESMIKKGYKQYKKFSWEKCAKETENIYKKTIEEKT